MMAIAGAPWDLQCEDEEMMLYLLTTGQWSDCTFMVGSDTNQTAAVLAHKFVLAKASPVFDAMFYGRLSERNDPIVQIPDFYPEAFRVLLQYIYTRKAVIESFDMAWDLWYGGNKYMLPHLVKECKKYICSVLGPKNACRAYEFACLFDEKSLMHKCIKIIKTETKEVLSDNSFVDLQLNTVLKVFSLDQLNVDNELELFNALVRYAEAEKMRKGQTSSPDDGGGPSEELSKKLLLLSGESLTSPGSELDSKPTTKVVTPEPIADKNQLKEVDASIRGALQKIRFLALTVQQFAEGPAVSGLLTKDESEAIFANLASTASSVKIPTGFSACWAPRGSNVLLLQCIQSGCLEHIIAAISCSLPIPVEEGGISNLIYQLSLGGIVGMKAACVLRKIVDNKPNIRDTVLNLGAIPAMLPYIHSDTPSTQLETYLWVYYNMCRTYNHILVSFELVSPALPHITELLVNEETDPDVLTPACKALVVLTDSQDERIEYIQAIPGLTKRLTEFLQHPTLEVQVKAMNIIANMLCGTGVQADRCLEAGCLDHIINFLKCVKSPLLKNHAARAARNIMSKIPHIKKALEKSILEPLIKLLSEEDVEYETDAAWAISNMCVNGTAEQLDELVSAGFLEPYCRFLSSSYNQLVVALLNGLCHLLQKVGENTRLALCVNIWEIGVPRVLTTLQQHDDEEIRLQASHLVETYFPNAGLVDNAQGTREYNFTNFN